MNEDRPPALQQLQQQARQHFSEWAVRLGRLRSFYFKVSDMKVQQDEVVDLTLSEAYDWPALSIDLALTDALSINWKQQLIFVDVQLRYPFEFVFALFDHLFQLETQSDCLAPVSFVELAFWSVKHTDLLFPFGNPTTNQCDRVLSFFVAPAYFGLTGSDRQVCC